MTIDLRGVKGIIWDLDNSLYRQDHALEIAFDHAFARTALEAGVDMSFEQAVETARQSYLRYGFSGHTLIESYKLDRATLHHAYHRNVDEMIIQASRDVIDLFGSISKRHALVTHGSNEYARRVLARLGIIDFFEPNGIFGFEDYAFASKSESETSFRMAQEILGYDSAEILMVEDSMRNLRIPHSMGMKTALIHHGKIPDEKPDFVQGLYENARDLLTAVKTA